MAAWFDAPCTALVDLRVEHFRPLLPPAILLEELPLGDRGSATVARGREEVSRVLNGDDDRLVIVVGPCSIHDPAAALDYAHRLKTLADDLAGDLCIVMRVYFEKPRTTVGWKGLINDPRLDGSFAINEGLRRARRLLIDLAELGLPAGCEFLDPISPQFTSDLVSLGRHRRPHDRESGASRAGLRPVDAGGIQERHRRRCADRDRRRALERAPAPLPRRHRAGALLPSWPRAVIPTAT